MINLWIKLNIQMKLFTPLLQLITWILKPFRYIRRRFILARNATRLEKVVEKQMLQRKALRKDINRFLREFFGIDARSKYIPSDFKNKEEVRVAILDKFHPRMDALNVNYTDLFR